MFDKITIVQKIIYITSCKVKIIWSCIMMCLLLCYSIKTCHAVNVITESLQEIQASLIQDRTRVGAPAMYSPTILTYVQQVNFQQNHIQQKLLQLLEQQYDTVQTQHLMRHRFHIISDVAKLGRIAAIVQHGAVEFMEEMQNISFILLKYLAHPSVMSGKHSNEPQHQINQMVRPITQEIDDMRIAIQNMQHMLHTYYNIHGLSYDLDLHCDKLELKIRHFRGQESSYHFGGSIETPRIVCKKLKKKLQALKNYTQELESYLPFLQQKTKHIEQHLATLSDSVIATIMNVIVIMNKELDCTKNSIKNIKRIILPANN